MTNATHNLIARLHRFAKVSYGATIEEAREVSKTLREAADLIERVIGDLPQDAIDGGWTALGMSKYAKGLETQIETLQRERDEAVAKLEARAGEAVAYANARHLAEKMASVPAFRERTEYYDVPLYLHPPTGDAAGKDSVDAALYTMDQMREYADNFHLSRMKVLVAEKEAYERHAPTEPTLDQIRKIEDDFGIVWFVPDDSETFAWRTTNTDERDKFVRALAAAKPVSVDAYVMPERSVVTAPMIDACALMIKGICMTHPQDAWTAEIKERICYMLKTPPTESTGEPK